MKKNIVIGISVIVVLILGFILFMYFNYNAIKKGTTFTNVNFKENIPNIKSKSEAGIKVGEILIAYKYYAENNCSLIGILINDRKYYYSFEDIYAYDNTLVYKKGWNSLEEKNGTTKTTPLPTCPVEIINGTVTYTSGNTSLIKKCLQGI